MSNVFGLRATRSFVKTLTNSSLLDGPRYSLHSITYFSSPICHPSLSRNPLSFANAIGGRQFLDELCRSIPSCHGTRSFSASSSPRARQVSKPSRPVNRHSTTNPVLPSSRNNRQRRLGDKDPLHGSNGETPLQNGDLNEADIIRIFGQELSPQTGNHVLRIFQWRRESGALAERGVSFPELPELTRPLALNALEYLRVTFPIDEEAAAAEWAERTAKEFEVELSQRGINFGLYKKPASESPDREIDAQGNNHSQRHGFSMLEQRQREVLAQQKEQERSLENQPGNPPAEKDKYLAERSLVIAKSNQAAELKRAANVRWIEDTARKAQLNETDIPTEISLLRRIWPSTFLALAVITFSLLFASAYTPPTSKSARLFPDAPPAFTTCAVIVGANILIYGLWHFPPAWRILNRYMMIVPAWPRSVSIVGNIFSHQNFSHLFWNMLTLMIIGPSVHEQVGRGDFVSLYMASGVCGSWASLVWLAGKRRFQYYSMGASAAVYGLLGAICTLNPSDHLRIPLPKLNEYEIPFSSSALIAVIVAFEVMTMVFRSRSNVSHMSHIGGALWGIGHAYFIKNRSVKAKERGEGHEKAHA